MRKVLAWILLAPLATLALLFAVANRRWVTVSFDPFSQEAPAYAVDLPLFIVIFVSLILGVLVGGIAVWFGRLRWQMAAHRAEREAARLKAERATAEERARAAAFGAPRTIAPPGDRAATG
ncbi:MAG: LapA family protein [Xanthobacteraceae bacterium]